MEHKQFFLTPFTPLPNEMPNLQRIDKDFNIKNKHIVTDNETKIDHGQKMKITLFVSTAVTTLIAHLSDYTIGVKNVKVARGIQLPKASLAGTGKLYVIKDMSGSASATTIAISPLDGETIDGDVGTSLNTNYATKRLYSDGSNWFSW